jgi:hypothetical protein
VVSSLFSGPASVHVVRFSQQMVCQPTIPRPLSPSVSKQPNLCNTKEQLVQLERIPFLQLFLDDIATFNIPGDGVNLSKFSVLLLLFADVLSSSSSLDLSLEFSSVADCL